MTLLSREFIRTLRLGSGMVLFAYVVSHFVNHAFGIRSVAAMDEASKFLLTPWQTLPGQVALLGAFAIHAALGLRALYRRRTLRMPPADLAQLVLGLAVPLLLVHHVVGVQMAEALYGMRIDYERVVYQLWVGSPFYGLPRQFLLLFVVWIHGCIGLRGWLRTKAWYPRWVAVLASLATLVPVVAVLGFVNAGLDMRDLAGSNDALIGPHVRDAPGTDQAAAAEAVRSAGDMLVLGWIGLVAAVFAARVARDWFGSRFKALRIIYPGGRIVTVPAGFSVLEASRWAGIPHASVCGGRGRCSTCRVEVTSGADTLLPPGPDEARLLARIAAPPFVRLACQIRPVGEIGVTPLVNPISVAQPGLGMLDARRRETEVAALFVDLRQSTKLADSRLPYDALFIVERYVTAVTIGVRRAGGHVINVAGDGVMSVFGVDGTATTAARDAFSGALAVWDEIDALSTDLGEEISSPLRFGMGLHVGLAVVGVGWDGGVENAPFLGDTGNVASRLEAASKRLTATLVASRHAVELVVAARTPLTFESIALAGKQEPVDVAAFRDPESLRAALGQTEPA